MSRLLLNIFFIATIHGYKNLQPEISQAFAITILEIVNLFLGFIYLRFVQPSGCNLLGGFLQVLLLFKNFYKFVPVCSVTEYAGILYFMWYAAWGSSQAEVSLTINIMSQY